MRNAPSLFPLVLLAVTHIGGHAQMDPSTALLLRRPSAQPATAPSLDTIDEEHYSARPFRRATTRPAPAIIIEPESVDATPLLPEPPPTAAFASLSPRQPASEEPVEHTEDTLSVRLGAGYLNLDAKASNAARDYAGGGGALDLGISLWATPTFGVKADYLSGVANAVKDKRTNYGLDHQELDAALIYRRPWAKRWLDFTLGYHQISNRVTRAKLSPLGTRSRGVDLGLGLTLPQGATYSHQFEAHLHPFLGHEELGQRTDAKSGTANTSYGASLSVGGLYAIERDRDLFWRARYLFEQNIFSNGPTVTTGQAMLILGVQWGS